MAGPRDRDDDSCAEASHEHLVEIMEEFGTLGKISERVMGARHSRRNRAIMRCAHIRNPLERFQAILNVWMGRTISGTVS